MYPKSDYDKAKYYTWVTEAQNTMSVNEQHTLTFGGEYRKVYYAGTRLGGQADAKGIKIKKHIQLIHMRASWRIRGK